METPNDRVVNSWRELNEAVFEGSYDPVLKRHRSPFTFRGLSEAAHDLKTSLIRLGHTAELTHNLEPVILRNFKKYAQRDASPGDSLWNWLALAQHRGLPTRLLDWTNSPHIAMHFATIQSEKFDRPGVIWCVNQYIIREKYLPDELRKTLVHEYAVNFNAEILNRVADSFRKFDTLSTEPFVVFFDPPALDERIVNQFALFSMMSSPTELLNDWLLKHPDTFHRIIIPAELKWEVRDKLDQMNITERMLMPGLDGLSSWLKRYYSVRQT